MKHSIVPFQAFFVSLLIIGAFSIAQSQEEHLRNFVKVGLSTPVLDNGWGINMGYNPVFSIGEHFAVEAYTGYQFARISHSFLSGEKSQIHTCSFLVGPRFYFIKNDHKIRPYINALVGPSLLIEKRKNAGYNRDWDLLSISTGLYTDINRFTLGFYISTFEDLGFKMGYAL